MMKGILLLLAVSTCTVSAATLFRNLNAAQGSAPVRSTEESEKHGCDCFTNAVRLTMMSDYSSTADEKKCAGVQLIAGWIMTAAECFDNANHTYARLTARIHTEYQGILMDIEHNDVGKKNRLEIKIHPEYNPTTKANNIALLRYSKLFKAEKNSVVDLPYSKDLKRTYEKETAAVFRYIPFASKNEHSMRTNVTLVDKCPRHQHGTQQNEYMCALASESSNALKKPPTENDVGAPLIYQKSGSGPKQVIGILNSILNTTEGNGLAMEFTRIQPFVNWINQITGMPLPIRR